MPRGGVEAQAVRASPRERRGPRQDPGDASDQGGRGGGGAGARARAGRRRQESQQHPEPRKRGSEKQGLLGEQQLLRGKYTTAHLFSSAAWRHALEMSTAFAPAAPRWEKPVWPFSS